MYDSLMESEERKERLRHRNQLDRDRHAAETAQQREARLTRRRVLRIKLIVLRGLPPRGRVLGHRRGRLALETPDQRKSRLEYGRS